MQLSPDSKPHAPRPTRDWIALGLVLIAVLLRVIYTLEQQSNPFFDYPLLDSLYHIEWARALAAGEDFQPGPFFRAPLYPWLLGTELRAFGEQYLWLRGLQSLLGGATVWLTYLIGRRAFGLRVGRLAAAFVATNWVLIYFDGELLIPTLAIPLNLLALYLSLGLAKKASAHNIAAAGMAWGVAAIARPNVLLFMPFLFLWLVLEDRSAWLAGLKRGALLTISVLVPILPISFYNTLVGGDAVLISSQAGVNLWIGNNPNSDGSTAIVPGTRPGWWDGYNDAIALAEAAEGRELAPSEVSAHYAARTRSFWLGDPGAALELMLWKLRLFVSRHELGNNQDVGFFAKHYSRIARWLPPSWLMLAPLGLIGLWLAVRDPRRTFPLWGFVPIYSASVLLFFVCSRFRAPLLPLLAVLAAKALFSAWDALLAKRSLPLCTGAGVWVLLTGLVFVVPERVDSTDAKGLWQLGMYELEQGRFNEALPYLYRSVEANPRFWVARRDLGLALRRTGQPKAAREQWSEALALLPGDVQSTALYVEVSLAMGQLDDAERVARECVARNPSLAGPYDTLAQVLLAREDQGAARAALLKGLTLSRDDFLCNIHLGLLEQRVGDACAAVEAFARAAASPLAPT